MWPNPQETEEIFNGKLHFLCSEQMLDEVIQPLELIKEKDTGKYVPLNQ